MWKAITGLVIGVLIGVLVCGPLYAGKNKKRIINDSDGDGVVEFEIPLYRASAYDHVCCTCSLQHRVYSRIIEGPLGLPWLHQRWEVDNRATHMNRVRKFGPDYWNPRRDPLEDMKENRW